MSSEESKHTFRCEFGDGVTATATIDVGLLRAGKGKTQFLTIEWDGERQNRHFSAYKRWMLTVQQHAAELLPGRILWVINNGGSAEMYRLEPGKPPQRTAG